VADKGAENGSPWLIGVAGHAEVIWKASDVTVMLQGFCTICVPLVTCNVNGYIPGGAVTGPPITLPLSARLAGRFPITEKV
jgi:hypothetical protein